MGPMDAVAAVVLLLLAVAYSFLCLHPGLVRYSHRNIGRVDSSVYVEAIP